MAYDIQKVIDIALGEVGYLEKESKNSLDSKTGNAGDNNYTKYARDLDAINFYNGRKQGAYWCDVFVDHCFYKAYGKSAALKLTCQPTKAANNCGAGCEWSLKYYKQKGQFHTTPKVGDQIFFYDSKGERIAHTGLVYKISNTRVYTVEGNTSGGYSVIANGGEVAKKSYTLGYKRIAGYGRPAYGTQTAEIAPETVSGVSSIKYTTHTVKRGETLWSIAKKHLGKGARYAEIKTLNGLASDVIKAGQVLKIPKV